MDDLIFKSAEELAGLVRGGQVSATEVVEAFLGRIEELNPSLNALIEVSADEALAEAGSHRGSDDARPFGGVPIAIKSNTAVEGRLLTFATAALADHRAGHSAYLVQRIQQAGFIIVGMSNLPEFGILPTTESRLHGPARNPWDTQRTPGGSSGGAAAAVASGMLPIAHGNDGGGSIRIPAACCGLVGLKPSRGRVSRGPDLGESFLTGDGVLTRTVADTALGLDVLAGYEVGDSSWAPRPVEPYLQAMRRDPGKLRIGFTSANALDVDIDPECARGLREGAELLAELGHEVFEVHPQMPPEETLGIFIACFGTWISLTSAYTRLVTGRELAEQELEPMTKALCDMAADMSATDFLVNNVRLQALTREFVALFADFDLMLTPALAERPLAIGECTGFGDDPMGDLIRSGRFTPFTALVNASGQPAITVPIGFGEDGLPTSIQLIGHPLAEETLLQVAAQIETARPWAQQRPRIQAASTS